MTLIDDKTVFCFCPRCGTRREKVGKYWTILRRGRERNGIARFFCKRCATWFNGTTGKHLSWQER